MQKKIFWLWLLSIFMLALSIFSLTACGKMDYTLYLGTYKDGRDTLIITKEYVNINGEKRTYTIDGNTLSIEGYTGDMHFYEHGKVLSFDVIVEFDSGRITERNKNFSTTLCEYSNGGISLAYTFNLDGTVSYFNADRPVENASGTYRIKDGVIKISTVNLLGKQNTMYLYVSEEGELHFTGVYVKDLDTYFDNGSGNASSSGNNSTNDNSSSDNDSGSNENENNPSETPPLTFYEVGLNYGYYEKANEFFNIQAGSAITLSTPQRVGYTFDGWSIDGVVKYGGDVITITHNVTAYAQWTIDTYNITYRLGEGSLENPKTSFTIHDLPYQMPFATPKEGESFVKWTTDEAGKNEVETITELGDYTLYAHYEDSAKCLTYKYSEELQGYVVADFTGNGTSVKIPSTYKGVAVKSIGDFAFSYCTSLTSVEIPDSVTSIGESAFSGCTSLTSIEIPDSVTSMDGSAFGNCLALKTIIIDSSDVANGSSFIGDISTYATDVYIRADITITVGIYNVLYNNLGKDTINGVEYYHYQIKGE